VKGAVPTIRVDVEGLVDDADGGIKAFVLAGEVQLVRGLLSDMPQKLCSALKKGMHLG